MTAACNSYLAWNVENLLRHVSFIFFLINLENSLLHFSVTYWSIDLDLSPPLQHSIGV